MTDVHILTHHQPLGHVYASVVCNMGELKFILSLSYQLTSC